MAFKLTKENIRPTTASMTLIHPVGGVTTAQVFLKGQISKEFKDAYSKMLKELGPDTDAEKLDKDTQVRLFGELYCSCIVGWNDELVDAVGEYSQENAMKFFVDADIDWIGSQIAQYVKDTANFFRSVPSNVGQVGSASEQGPTTSESVEVIQEAGVSV